MTNKPAAREAQEPSASAPKKKDKFNRFAWRDAVFADPKTPPNAKCLAFGIAKFVDGETGEAFPSTVTLAEVCGLSETWVRKTIPVLHATGWIEVQFGSRGRGEKHCNRYSINPEKRTPCAVLAHREKRTVKAHFSPLKAHPVCEEPLNHKEERPYGTRSVCVDRGDVTDARPNPVKATAHDAALMPETKSAPVGALIGNLGESQPTNSVATGSSFLARRAVKQSGNGAALDQKTTAERSSFLNGHAARRPDNLPRKSEEIAMTKPIDDEHFEKFFVCLLAKYPRRDAADAARAALRKVFAESSDHGQTRCLLLDGAAAYERETRAKGSTAFLRLDDFVRGESWTVENLPFNLLQAT